MGWRYVAVACLVACAGHAEQIETAKHAQYDAELPVIYQGVVDVLKEKYSNVDARPDGTLHTAWYQVESQSSGEMVGNDCTRLRPCTHVKQQSETRSFIRFDVAITGGRPWVVTVLGHGAKWTAGAAIPNELRGADEPPWVKERANALLVKIHEQIKRYAVPARSP